MEKKSALFLTQAAMIAALYVVLTYIANLFGLASGVIQIRLSRCCVSFRCLRRRRYRGCLSGAF